MASISTLGFDDAKTKSAMRGANVENFNVIISGHSMRDPRRMIYIHTVAKRSFGPLTRTLFPKLTLIGCEAGERYVTCCPTPDPISQVSPDQERGGSRIDEHDGWRAAIDLLNPANLTTNPYSGDNNADFFANRSGQNLIAEGFWPSLHAVPPEEEIKAAEKRRDRHYQYLTREAQRLAAVSTKDLNEFLQQYPDVHLAMDSLGLEANWHSRSEVKSSCPNCGDSIRQGIAFHKSSVTDRLCVIDPEKAYKSRAITREEYEELITAPEEVKRGPGRPKKEL
jgi:hypothetical protein